MGASSKLTILRSFIASNFSYRCHIWCFCSVTLKDRLEKIQFRGLCYVYDDYNLSYEALLKKAGMDSIALLLQKTMLLEIYKSLNGIGAAYFADLFNMRGPPLGQKVKIYKFPGLIAPSMDFIPFATMVPNSRPPCQRFVKPQTL